MVNYNFVKNDWYDTGDLVRWLGGDENDADLFTKNLPAATFHKHTKVYCGDEDLYHYGENVD